MNKDSPAFAAIASDGLGGLSGNDGMTIRQYYAAAALTGLMANKECLLMQFTKIAADAVLLADALIEAESA